jgi:diguanylate cyclase (GGDEF)-like protein
VTAGEVNQQFRTMLTSGKSAEAVARAEKIAAQEGTDAGVRADLLLLRVAGVFNLGQRARMKQALDDATDAVRAVPTADRYARLYAYHALSATVEGNFERCVAHLVRSAQALVTVDRVDEEIACTWHDLAMSYSYAGFHGYALGAMEESRKKAREAGINEGDFFTPAIRIRLAVWHDHLGDSEACKRVLLGVIDELDWHQRVHREGNKPMKPSSLVSYGYALARLAVLGELMDVDPRPLLAPAPTSIRVRDFRHLAQVCLRIAGGRAEEALERLNTIEVAAATVGEAEPLRLRALAHLHAGRPVDAYTADRAAFRLVSAHGERIRELFIEGTAARLQHEQMQARLAKFQGEATTDPLTGLANRRSLEQYLARLAEEGRSAVVAVCDMDGFKAVNDVHGHIIGDLVLQRVGRILSRSMRRDDLVARYGGDEFVVVMPEAGPEEGQDLAHRVARAMSAEDWASIAPGTPIGVTIGWAHADGHGALQDAFATADKAMLQAKPVDRRRKPRPTTTELSITGLAS